MAINIDILEKKNDKYFDDDIQLICKKGINKDLTIINNSDKSYDLVLYPFRNILTNNPYYFSLLQDNVLVINHEKVIDTVKINLGSFNANQSKSYQIKIFTEHIIPDMENTYDFDLSISALDGEVETADALLLGNKLRNIIVKGYAVILKDILTNPFVLSGIDVLSKNDRIIKIQRILGTSSKYELLYTLKDTNEEKIICLDDRFIDNDYKVLLFNQDLLTGDKNFFNNLKDEINYGININSNKSRVLDIKDKYSDNNIIIQTPLQELAVTANGTVTPAAGYVGLSKVSVNVASSGSDIVSINGKTGQNITLTLADIQKYTKSFATVSATEPDINDSWEWLDISQSQTSTNSVLTKSSDTLTPIMAFSAASSAPVDNSLSDNVVTNSKNILLKSSSKKNNKIFITKENKTNTIAEKPDDRSRKKILLSNDNTYNNKIIITKENTSKNYILKSKKEAVISESAKSNNIVIKTKTENNKILLTKNKSENIKENTKNLIVKDKENNNKIFKTNIKTNNFITKIKGENK